MWIRSQNGNRLCEAYGDIFIVDSELEEPTWAIIRLDRRTVTEHETKTGGTILGEYDTEARALEVLDEIQEYIDNQDATNFSKQEILNLLMSGVISEEVAKEKGNKLTNIYQMPQE